MRYPDFFIIGAPKAGTTALHDYLRVHPEVFMPRKKEPHFFGSDLQSPHYVRDERAYLGLFTEARHRRAGEASVWYLYSRSAAVEIADRVPAARLIAMLRNPFEMVPSYHSQRLYNGTEDVPDLLAAFELEQARRDGRCLPRYYDHVHGLGYSTIARYGEQLQRYLRVFPVESVLVVLFDDFRVDPSAVYREVLRWLRLDHGHEPDFEVVNPNARVRSTRLRNLLRRPGPTSKAVVSRLLPAPVRQRLRKRLILANTAVHGRPPLRPAEREWLHDAYHDDVLLLSSLLGRDLARSWGFSP